MTLNNDKTALDELIRQRGSYLAFLPSVTTIKGRKKLLAEIKKLTDEIYLIYTGEKYDKRKDLKTSGTSQAVNTIRKV